MRHVTLKELVVAIVASVAVLLIKWFFQTPN
jgi:hypothetical protein